MKVSIITAAFNCSRTVRECVLSVQRQNYNNIEHIVIDGASSDNTIEIIKNLPNRVKKIVSEPDVGLYDALNKGIELATGDIIGFLHTDDVFCTNDTISDIVSAFEEGGEDVSGTYGDLVYVDRCNPDKIIRYWKSSCYHPRALTYGWMPPHPTLFLRRNVYQEYGNFNLDYNIAADYDFILRIMKDTDLNFQYIPNIISKMRTGGVSNKDIGNILKKSIEDFIVIQKNGFGGLYTLICKNIRKIMQFIFTNNPKAQNTTKLILFLQTNQLK